MSDSELRWTVALEAALFFSMPSWWLMAKAWPANGPWQFALAVVAGATAAAVLFHAIPAMCAPALVSVASNRFGRVLLSAAGAWLCIGAAIELARLARVGGSNFLIGQPESWQWGAAIVFGLIAVLTAWAPIGSQRPVIAMCLLLGCLLAAASLCLQWAGQHTRHSAMASEPTFVSCAGMVDGMLTASAPAAILAYRIGRRGASRKTILWTAVLGLWLPLCASATLICVAMMFGARLYWKPSLPITADWAFGWLFAGSPLLKGEYAPARLGLLGASNLAPAIVCAIWVKDLTGGLPSGRWKLLAWCFLAAIGWYLAVRRRSFFYDSVWISSIALAVLGMPLLSLLAKLRR